LLITLIVFSGLSVLVSHYSDVAQENSQIQQQEIVLQQVSNLRASIEHEINTSLNLTMGVLVYVSANPEIQQKEFATLAHSIMQYAPYIRNIGLARDNVISHIYPVEGNRKALGLRYMDNPHQRDAVIQAMETRQTVVAGPVNLVQGGEGLISRIPIFLSNKNQSYWGMTSVVVDLTAFLDKVGLFNNEENLRIAIRGKDSKGEQGDIFYGEPGLFSNKDTVKLKISLPTGHWIIAAAPAHHSTSNFNESDWVLIIGFAATILICLLLFGLLTSNTALNHAKIQVELASEHKSRFFTNMAHELRTPLTSIHGAVRLINSGALDNNPEQAKELIESAERNSKRLIWLINDILDLRKLESGKMEYQKSLQSPINTIEVAINDIQPYASEYDIKIELQNTAPPDIQLEIDNMRIQQVIVNLLSNAVKFSPKHSVISVKTTFTETQWRCEVSDQGKGVPPDQIDTIFAEFSQASASDKKNVSSTGLGLSISRHIMLDHNGHIGCFNQLKSGATFYIELPLST